MTSDNVARMTVRNGPFLGPVLSRVLGMLAARAQAPIDRLDDALLVADAVAAHAPDHTLNGTTVVEMATHDGVLELTIGGLRPQGGEGLLADATLPGVGNVLERVADEVAVRTPGGTDGEQLHIRLGFGAG